MNFNFWAPNHDEIASKLQKAQDLLSKKVPGAKFTQSTLIEQGLDLLIKKESKTMQKVSR